jgi:hypothetical protein
MLLYVRANAETLLDVWALPLRGNEPPFPVVQAAGEVILNWRPGGS